MIKKLVAALILTFPIYAFVGGSDLVTYWFTHGNGWNVFSPLLDMLQKLGVSGRATVIYAVMLVISFILSLSLVFVISAYIARRQGNG
ncbi:hypothetical protein RBA63_19400 [Brenneria goodwinii]|uniref:hypothetical protein n=1 Tax=Brenneria goodwinii TaxID=1109412 RepID=UPI0036DFBF11